MTREEAEALCSKALNLLMEHCDAVQILTTWRSDAGTQSYYSGRGNWFARTGMASDFLDQAQARTQAREIGEEIKPPPDDSEGWKQA